MAELTRRKIIGCVAADMLSLVLLAAPGEQGADVVRWPARGVFRRPR